MCDTERETEREKKSLYHDVSLYSATFTNKCVQDNLITQIFSNTKQIRVALFLHCNKELFYTDDTVQWNTIQYNTIQYNTIKYNTILYNVIQYNVIQYNVIQYNTI